MNETVSLQTLQRMPLYLNFLRAAPESLRENVSAKMIADALGLGEIQVRKDLAAVSDGGRPKIGYSTRALIGDIETFLGCNDVNAAVLVGAGKLGRALLGYEGFRQYGLNIVSAFDADPFALGVDESGKQVLSVDKLPDLCRRMHVHIGIITVPADKAQDVCNLLVESGVTAIWNFAPAHLTAPENILIKSENMAASLAQLSRHLKDVME